ncbi:MAG: bifunctional adenosylcobinamide kinase/adenosylcobinamide-phosphate guanylyltransferase, partial [Firmicutes bacterium]|nr:bifunctional adenosylcobinamide kinase/adenosylcobinamide-phosphate guanylyltransferase [Bacillota bacterium]
MTIFISGGCKNGKSTIAEDCCAALACGGPLYYIATMQAYDDEDRARIKRHQNSRAGKGFITIEQPRDLL